MLITEVRIELSHKVLLLLTGCSKVGWYYDNPHGVVRTA